MEQMGGQVAPDLTLTGQGNLATPRECNSTQQFALPICSPSHRLGLNSIYIAYQWPADDPRQV